MFQETLTRRFALHEDRVREPASYSVDELLEGAVGTSEHEGSSARDVAERDHLVRKARVVAIGAGLGQVGRNVEERLFAKVERRGKDELAYVIETESAAQEARLECGRDEDRGRPLVPQRLSQDLGDVDRRPRECARLGPGDLIGVVERKARLDVPRHSERSACQRVSVLSGSLKLGD